MFLKVDFNPKLKSFLENWSVLGVIKQATRVKHVGQYTVVSLNVEILKDLVVQVDIVNLKIPFVCFRRSRKVSDIAFEASHSITSFISQNLKDFARWNMQSNSW